ncbi:MAG: hypothetical protein COV36_02985 [Alphaproteobacteria bacterium CG11_big_fil_rev_8_21_14_0_20_44_7]|nr:MAG: hypothetical protein COV36_02985 [Alphaproteobacteria bacterium CG11_big_fil_rev_8_21_14_0_20_44_7]
MKFNKIISAGLITTMLATTACSSSPYNEYGQNNQIRKTEMGTLVGAAAGALAGAQFGKGRGRLVTTAIGTLAGAAIGHEFGVSMDRADMAYYERTAGYALESSRIGNTTTWRNPDSGNYGTITPTNTYQQADGRYCREYNQTVTVGGRTERAYGQACRQPDGTWEII